MKNLAHRDREHVRRIHAAGVCACALLTGACATSRSSPDPDASPGAPLRSPIEPVVQSDAGGLEAQTWAAADTAPRLRALLERYAASAPLDPVVADLWARSGLRAYAVPIEDLDRLRREMQLAGALTRAWIGQTQRWTELARGQEWRAPTLVALPDARLWLGPGHLRLLARCWAVPRPAPARDDGAPAGVAAALHVQLVLQHVESAPASRPLAETAPAAPRAPEDAGLVFSRMLAPITLLPGTACLVLAEEPEVPDTSLPEPVTSVPSPAPAASPRLGVVQSRAAGGTPPSGPNAPDPAPARDPLSPGPPAERVPTLGELALTLEAAAVGEGVPRRRAIVVALVPRLPPEFRLAVPAPAVLGP